MKNLKETLAIVTAAVVSVAFTGGLLSTLHMVNHDVTASAETLKLRDSGRLGNCGYYDVNISYQVIEEQYWDDEIGAPVYNNYIEINSVYIEASAYMMTTTVPDGYDYSSGVPSYTEPLIYQIPSEIDGVPVVSIEELSCSFGGNMTYRAEITVPEGVTSIGSVNFDDNNSDYHYSEENTLLFLPDTIESIGTIESYGYPALNTIYSGTLRELFEIYPYIYQESGIFICSDGEFNTKSPVFNGTCAEWIEICPVNFEEISVTCTDGNA